MNKAIATKSVLVIFLSGFLLSCGGSSKDTRLTLGFGVTQAIFVPYTTTAPLSCTESFGSSTGTGLSVQSGDLQAQADLNYYLKFSYPTIGWTSTNSTVEIILISFKIKNASINGGQEYSQVIDSTELSTMYARTIAANAGGTYDITDPWSPPKLPWSASTAPTTLIYTKTPNSSCSYFLLKGIPLSKKRAFKAQGTFEVIAIETAADGTQTPIQTSTTVNVESVGI